MDEATISRSADLPPASETESRGYFLCPGGCGTYFKSRKSVVDHIAVDHWWGESPEPSSLAARALL